MKVSIVNFKGIRPKMASHLLEESEAQTALNCSLESGIVRALNKPEIVSELTTTDTLGMFQYLTGANAYWVTSEGNLDAVRSPIAVDTYERMYFTGPMDDCYTLGFDAQQGTFTIGNIVYQTVAGTTVSALIIDVTDNGSSGTLTVINPTGVFQNDYPIYEATLGADIWDAAAAAFTSGTYAWAVEGTNTIANVSNSLEITYVDTAQGATNVLADAGDLSSDLTAGVFYKVTLDSKVNSGSVTVEVRKTDETILATDTVTEQDFTAKILVFKATATTTDELTMAGMGAGEVGYIDNISLKPITNAADCNGTLTATNYYLPRYFANDYLSSPFDQTTDFIKMGIPTPAAAPTYSSGHTGDTNYVAHFYTYVNRYGIEGPPSPIVSASTWDGSSTIVIGGFTEAPEGYACNSENGGLSPKIRLYRTASSGAGVAAFQFVKDTTVNDATNYTTLTITDDVAAADLGEVCPSVYWYAPDHNMRGLIGLSNGIFAGFYMNTLFLSDPFYPEAWPTSYEINFSETIIGLGFIGTTIVVCTDQGVYLVYGAHPSAMSKQKLPGFYPCLSKTGIVSTEYGVFYPSHEGIMLVSQDGVRNISKDFLTVSDMIDLYPATWVSAYFGGRYISFYKSGDFLGGIVFNNVTGNITKLDFYMSAVHLSINDHNLYCAGRNVLSSSTEYIHHWEGDLYNYKQFTWKSKKYLLPRELNISTARIVLDQDFYDYIVDLLADNEYLEDLNEDLFALDLEGSVNGSEMNVYPINGDTLYTLSGLSITPDVTFKLYVDGELKFTKTISTDGIFRLPSGFRGRKWEVQLQGYIPVRELTLAPSVSEAMGNE